MKNGCLLLVWSCFAEGCRRFGCSCWSLSGNGAAAAFKVRSLSCNKSLAEQAGFAASGALLLFSCCRRDGLLGVEKFKSVAMVIYVRGGYAYDVRPPASRVCV